MRMRNLITLTPIAAIFTIICVAGFAKLVADALYYGDIDSKYIDIVGAILGGGIGAIVALYVAHASIEPVWRQVDMQAAALAADRLIALRSEMALANSMISLAEILTNEDRFEAFLEDFYSKSTDNSIEFFDICENQIEETINITAPKGLRFVRSSEDYIIRVDAFEVAYLVKWALEKIKGMLFSQLREDAKAYVRFLATERSEWTAIVTKWRDSVASQENAIERIVDRANSSVFDRYRSN